MDIEFDAKKNQYSGTQKLTLWNHSPDTLDKLYYHVYFNAFQPGSDMDIRSLTIEDPDPRIGRRISALKESEIGYHIIKSIEQNGKALQYCIEGTILEVQLHKELFPGNAIEIIMKHQTQVPLQIRRSGRNNKEGIDYSMSQWYPKLCMYDRHGWHTDPYIGREFYGNFGDFFVNIIIEQKYCVAAGGIQLNSEEVNCFKEKSQVVHKGKKTWNFKALNVHDFVWAADPDYVHETLTRNDERKIHIYYQPSEKNSPAWKELPIIMDKALDFIEKNFGIYAYPSYSFIQGGDGGMEYPMATLITGNRSLVSLVGVSLHEWMHSWYQMMIATNESLYGWMDEGFASYAEEEVMNYLKSQNLIPDAEAVEDPHRATVEDFVEFISGGGEEPLSTHADHFTRNRAYGVGSYVKGALCLHQLKYIMGESKFKEGLLDYYWAWRFKHPEPDDFFRIMEKVSGLELDWFQQYWVYTTKTIDYRVDTIIDNNSFKTTIHLFRNGDFPMPIDLRVILVDGSNKLYHIPLDLMRGSKTFEKNTDVHILSPWHWVNPKFAFEIPIQRSKISEVVIDPNFFMPDVNRGNNSK